MIQTRYLAVLIVTCFALVSLWAHADSQRFVDYVYDGAGNIISVRSGQNLGPPDVTNLAPAFVHKESFAFVTATGINLTKATVSVNTLGVSLLNVTNISDTEIKFTLFADDTAQIGLVPITFTTRLGSDVENIAIADRTPVISTDPNPIILTPASPPVLVRLTFDQPFATDQVYDVKITDGAIATVSQQQVILLMGETQVTVTVSALLVGSTTLEINQLVNFLALGIPVIVTDDILPPGNYTQYTAPVGVAVYIEQPSNTNGPFTVRPVGIGAYIELPSSTNGPFTARPVGVASYIEPPSSTNGPFVAPIVGSAYGAVVDQVSPLSIARSSSVILTVDGIELNTITTVSFNPGTGITQTGSFTVSPDGLRMMIPIDVSASATTGVHTIVLTTSTGDQIYSDNELNITN